MKSGIFEIAIFLLCLSIIWSEIVRSGMRYGYQCFVLFLRGIPTKGVLIYNKKLNIFGDREWISFLFSKWSKINTGNFKLQLQNKLQHYC